MPPEAVPPECGRDSPPDTAGRIKVASPFQRDIVSLAAAALKGFGQPKGLHHAGRTAGARIALIESDDLLCQEDMLRRWMEHEQIPL